MELDKMEHKISNNEKLKPTNFLMEIIPSELESVHNRSLIVSLILDRNYV